MGRKTQIRKASRLHAIALLLRFNVDFTADTFHERRVQGVIETADQLQKGADYLGVFGVLEFYQEHVIKGVIPISLTFFIGVEIANAPVDNKLSPQKKGEEIEIQMGE